MKLIHIFAIAAAITAVSTAQNATPANANGKPQTVASNAGNKPSAVIATNTPKISVPAANVTAAAKPAKSQEAAKKSSTPSTSNGKAPAPVGTAKPTPQDPGQSKSVTASAHKKPAARRKGPQVSKTSKVPANGATPAAQTDGSHGRRDPFISAIRTANSGGPAGPPCATGKRCLSIPELTLHGIVKDATGKMMALVVTPTNRMYILRESDQVFNGSVVKITSDSVIFREYATDKLGHETAHEVVKKITVGS
jgi:hypothetical protein